VAPYKITKQHLLKIASENGTTYDKVLSWFPEDGHKAWGQKKLRAKLRAGTTFNQNTATEIQKVLSQHGFEAELSFFATDPTLPAENHAVLETYPVDFPSDTTSEDIERLSLPNSLTGFYRLTRHKFSDAMPNCDYVVDYINIYHERDDLHFTMYAICSTSSDHIEFTGTVRRLGHILFLAGKRIPDAKSPTSFKMLFLQDEGAPSMQRSRIRWGIITTKTLSGAEKNPASARILLEKTHSVLPRKIPKPSFKSVADFKTAYPGRYSNNALLYRAVISLISNNVEKHPINMNKAIPGPDLTLGVSQGTIDEITGRLIENLGDLIDR